MKYYIGTISSGGSDNHLKSFYVEASDLEKANILLNNELKGGWMYIVGIWEIAEEQFPYMWNASTPILRWE